MPEHWKNLPYKRQNRPAIIADLNLNILKLIRLFLARNLLVQSWLCSHPQLFIWPPLTKEQA